MSSLQSPVGSRQRTAAAAVERARLALVPVGATRAPRAPFAVLVFLILGAGVVGLLMFNTGMQQGSFYATRLQARADDLTARKQALEMQLQRLRDPQRLADASKELGMVAPGVPAFVNLADGQVIGIPTPATSADSVRISPLPAKLPSPLAPRPIIVRVQAPTTPTTPASGQTPAGTGPASTSANGATGRNEAATAAQGAPR